MSLPSGDRLNVNGDTSVRLERQRGRVVARISRGDVLAEAERPGALAIEAFNYRITSEAGPATCLVEVLPDRRTLVSARQGRIAVTDLRSGVVKNLAAGEQIAMAAPLVPGQEPEPSQPAPPRPAGQAPPPTAPAQPATPPEPSTPPAPGPSGPNTTPAASHGSNTVLILLVAGGAAAAAAGIAAAAGGGHGGGGGAPVSPSAP